VFARSSAEHENLSVLLEVNRACIDCEGVKEMTEETKKVQILPSSPKALALCEVSTDNQPERTPDEDNAKYPFRSLQVGESFAIPFADTNPGTLASLRSSASSYGKRLNRKYRVFVHDEYKCVEVARLK
jgi:hypothetical protein